jgi:hypothetical protein
LLQKVYSNALNRLLVMRFINKNLE